MDNGDFQTETQRSEFESNVHDIASLTESDTETAEAACDKNDSDSSRKEKSNVDKPETHSKKRKFPRELREFLIRITATVIVLWFTLTFLIGVYICHSNTCYPMVKDGDLCVTWRPETPSQGDLIVYMHNGEPCFGRVAAIPGDKVTISEGIVWVNGFIAQAAPTTGSFDTAVEEQSPFTVPEDSVFVLNDNSSDTNDSRLFGTIPLSECRGSVIFLMRRRGF